MIQNTDENNNSVIGYMPDIEDSSIKFVGKNNVLYCEKNVCGQFLDIFGIK